MAACIWRHANTRNMPRGYSRCHSGSTASFRLLRPPSVLTLRWAVSAVVCFAVLACTYAARQPDNRAGGAEIEQGRQVELACQPPVQQHAPKLSFPGGVQLLAGTYALAVIATGGYGDDTVSYGELSLAPTDAEHRLTVGSPRWTTPLYEWGDSDIDL